MQEIAFLFLNLLSFGILGFLVVIFFRLIFSKKAPFVPIPEEALSKLLSETTLDENDVVYDLGCGDGRVLVYLAKKFRGATYIGIELRLFPYLLAKIRSRKYANITIIRGDFFKQDLTQATHIVTYLFPHVMDSLLPKLEAELKHTTLISFDFSFSKKEAARKMEFTERKGALGSKVFIYRFE